MSEVDERDTDGNLTDWALACDALQDAGCDCGDDEPGTCLGCLCERAMRTERERAERAEAEVARLMQERDAARRRSEMFACAYCGFEGPREPGVLSAHIDKCDKNPVFAMLRRAEKAEAERDALRRRVEEAARLAKCDRCGGDVDPVTLECPGGLDCGEPGHPGRWYRLVSEPDPEATP